MPRKFYAASPSSPTPASSADSRCGPRRAEHRARRVRRRTLAALVAALVAIPARSRCRSSLDEIAAVCAAAPRTGALRAPDRGRAAEAPAESRDARRRDAHGLALSRRERRRSPTPIPRNGERTYSLWDYLERDQRRRALHDRRRRRRRSRCCSARPASATELPTDPTLSPDRQHLVTADFCAEHCTNELAVWRVTRDGVRKDARVDARASPGPTRRRRGRMRTPSRSSTRRRGSRRRARSSAPRRPDWIRVPAP